MSSKHYFEDEGIAEGVRAENVRTNEDITVVSCLDSFNDIWIVENNNDYLYLERGHNICNPFYYD